MTAKRPSWIRPERREEGEPAPSPLLASPKQARQVGRATGKAGSLCSEAVWQGLARARSPHGRPLTVLTQGNHFTLAASASMPSSPLAGAPPRSPAGFADTFPRAFASEVSPLARAKFDMAHAQVRVLSPGGRLFRTRSMESVPSSLLSRASLLARLDRGGEFFCRELRARDAGAAAAPRAGGFGLLAESAVAVRYAPRANGPPPTGAAGAPPRSAPLDRPQLPPHAAVGQAGTATLAGVTGVTAARSSRPAGDAPAAQSGGGGS